MIIGIGSMEDATRITYKELIIGREVVMDLILSNPISC
jgi:hypothetical protein